MNAILNGSNSSNGAVFKAKMAEKALQCLSLIVMSLALNSTNAIAQLPTPPLPPATPELEARLKKLETELRCLVCQNQTLAESPAGLAGDLRRSVRELADSGKTDEEIKQHLRARYGDFVLYKPEVDSRTWLLWFGPFVLLLTGGLFVWRFVRRVKVAPATPDAVSIDEAARAKQLMDD